ncbi:cache domain-containing protein [Agromyces sp. S2-1-8]|uniref:cache domain-containing protein n=1 Tax=Agromyces sp. S2-1-8 TaxID=2897180 RepID=UPI001E305FEF|nr:cache domain-containing protein [Agromyces sp. S2-1-8]MCD5348347.1 cache domain-containing protein [Agromyces sp. S2-1-8]
MSADHDRSPSPSRRGAREAADAVARLFDGAFDLLAEWRSPIEQAIAPGIRAVADRTALEAERAGRPGERPAADAAVGEVRPAELDQVVAGLVLPRLTEPEALLVGAGFIADGEIVRGRDVHFAWWLGPLDDNPVLGSTDAPTRLDLSTRGYTEYLRDFRALEWYRIPATTRHAHVTGPYVDHLCTCDYILTLTMPVHAPDGERMVGVVGADISVRRLEQELLPRFLAVDAPLALVNADGRVVLSTDPALQVGQLADASAAASLECPGTPFRVLVGD